MEKPDTYDFWSASARRAYDEMEARALKAEAKLENVRSSLNTGIDLNETHDTLTWNAAMVQVLNTMLTETASSLNPDSIFEIATRNICQFLDVSSVYICDWNSQDKSMTVLADYFGEKANPEELESDVGVNYKIGTNFERLLTKPQHYLIYQHADEKLPYADVLAYDKYGVKTVIYAPLYAGDQLIGFIEAWDTSQRRDFTKNQTEFLVYVATKIASGVRMAQLHRAMVESEQRYRTLMHTIESGVARVDSRGIIQFVNRHFSDMLNMAVEDIVGQNLDTLWKRKAQSSDIPGEYLLKNKDDNPMWVQVVRAPIPGETVAIIGEAVVYTDITRRKEAEELRLRMKLENERIDLLANFIQDTSHEFYTPLSVINTRLFMLRRKFDDPVLIKGLYEIEQQADTITGLIKVLVEMTKLDAVAELTFHNYNIALLVEQVVNKHQSRKKDQLLHFESDSDRIMMPCDAERLGMAIDKIIDNALNYTAAHGTIVVRVRQQPEQVQIVVKDTGIGMSDDSQKRVFERFYRADEAHTTRGFGLGLSIAKRVVDLHHGSISVESKVDSGSTFVISLPLEVDGD